MTHQQLLIKQLHSTYKELSQFNLNVELKATHSTKFFTICICEATLNNDVKSKTRWDFILN
jgi:hypothetical protein